MGSALFSIFPQALFLGSVPSCENKQPQTLLFLGKMDDQQQFCLRWNDFQTNMVASFKHLRDEKSFTDVTIACDGQSCKAHKMILSACSPYFKALLEENPAKHPIIILKDVPFAHLTAILEFMYAGEVNVAQDQLPQFLKTAERLKVKGLAEAPQSVKDE